jgi:hypothetical protein
MFVFLAGKTTLLRKLKKAEPIITTPTVGFNLESLHYRNVTFTMWDVGGQEKIRALWHHYFVKSQVHTSSMSTELLLILWYISDFIQQSTAIGRKDLVLSSYRNIHCSYTNCGEFIYALVEFLTLVYLLNVENSYASGPHMIELCLVTP